MCAKLTRPSRKRGILKLTVQVSRGASALRLFLLLTIPDGKPNRVEWVDVHLTPPCSNMWST
jgi:hypothetical protein